MGAILTRKATVPASGKLQMESLNAYKAQNVAKLKSKLSRSNATRHLNINKPHEITQANIEESNVGIEINNWRNPVEVPEIKRLPTHVSNSVRKNNSRVGAKKTAVLTRINNSKIAKTVANLPGRERLVSINENIQAAVIGGRHRRRRTMCNRK